MNLQPWTRDIVVQQEFIHQTAGMITKVGNATLDGASFTRGEYVKAGTVVTIGDDGLAKPYEAGTAEAPVTGHVVVTHSDVKIPETGNAQIGVLEEAYLNGDRITPANPATLEADSKYRFKVR